MSVDQNNQEYVENLEHEEHLALLKEAEKSVVIDTETSGLFDFSKPASAEGQPRMASIASRRRSSDRLSLPRICPRPASHAILTAAAGRTPFSSIR